MPSVIRPLAPIWDAEFGQPMPPGFRELTHYSAAWLSVRYRHECVWFENDPRRRRHVTDAQYTARTITPSARPTRNQATIAPLHADVCEKVDWPVLHKRTEPNLEGLRLARRRANASMRFIIPAAPQSAAAGTSILAQSGGRPSGCGMASEAPNGRMAPTTLYLSRSRKDRRAVDVPRGHLRWSRNDRP